MRATRVAWLFLGFTLSLSAATETWDGSSSGAWNVAANWTPSGIPAAGDDLVFPAGAMNLTMTSFNAPS